MNKSAPLSTSKFVMEVVDLEDLVDLADLVDLEDSVDLGDLVDQEELEDLEDLLQELEVGMAQLLLLLVVLYQDSSAAVFQNDGAQMFPDKFPGKSAKLFQNKNA